MANPFFVCAHWYSVCYVPFNDFFCREVRCVNNYEFKCIENGKDL